MATAEDTPPPLCKGLYFGNDPMEEAYLGASEHCAGLGWIGAAA